MAILLLILLAFAECSKCPHFILQNGRVQILSKEREARMATSEPTQNGSRGNSSSVIDKDADVNSTHVIEGSLRDEQTMETESFGQGFHVDARSESFSDCPESEISQPEVYKKAADKVLDVTGLFALTGEYNAGLAYLAAAIIAVKAINQRTDILPGYTIRINAHDTKCSEPDGLDAFYKEVYNLSRTSIMTMGGTCSHVTEATAQVSDLWGIPEISYSAVSPYLSNKQKFPSFFRVMSPEQYLTSARIKLFKTMGWKKLYTIFQNYFLFSTLDESMRQEMAAAGIEVVSSGHIFTQDPTPNVRTLIQNDARIILASMYEEKLRMTMCTAYHLARQDTNRSYPWYKRVVWLLPSFIDRHWMDRTTRTTNCTREQIMEVAGNYFSIGSTVFSQSPGYRAVGDIDPVEFANNYTGKALYQAAADMIPERFQRLYTEALMQSNGESLPSEHRNGQAYDCVWAIALALNNTMSYFLETGDNRTLMDFRYRDRNFSSILYQAMMNVSFNALSGPFVFNSKGEKSPVIDIWRFAKGDDFQYTWLGRCICEIGKIDVCNCTLDKNKIRWENDNPPVDGTQTVRRVVQVRRSLLYVFRTLSSLGIILSFVLLAFNIINRNHRIIKMSSPRLNNVILLGCVLAYCNVLLLEVSAQPAVPMCEIRSFTILLSFSFSFGALFAKTWRVYQIFTAGSALRRLSTKMLRDSSLFLIVSALVTINSLILVAWRVVSPQKPTLVAISTTPADELTDTEFVNLHQRCDSPYKSEFTWAVLALQGVVILAGTFLAVQTRKVSCPALNDSKLIGVCIYHVVVLCPLAVVVVMATENRPDTSYALEASITILVTTMTQCLIFMPKIFAYRKHNESQPSQPESELTFYRGSLAFSRRSDTTMSASSRSIAACAFSTQLPCDFKADAVTCLVCPKCHSYISLATNFATSAHVKRTAAAEGRSRTVSESCEVRLEDARRRSSLHHDFGIGNVCCSFCRLPKPDQCLTDLPRSRRNSDSNLSKYMLRRYVSMS